MRLVSPLVPAIYEEVTDNGNYFEKSFERAVQEAFPKSSNTKSKVVESLQLPLPPGMPLSGSSKSRTWRPFEPISSNSNYISSTSPNIVTTNIVPSTSRPIDMNSTLNSYNCSYAHEIYNNLGCSSNSFNLNAPTKYFMSLPQTTGDSLELRMRSQERNRMAAMKSRQRKKKEWERLLESEKNLAMENEELKKELAKLHETITILQEKLDDIV